MDQLERVRDDFILFSMNIILCLYRWENTWWNRG
jgi:hypothetical protein